nr:hypothetical protein CFP56_23891 [Quercus suber]
MPHIFASVTSAAATAAGARLDGKTELRNPEALECPRVTNNLDWVARSMPAERRLILSADREDGGMQDAVVNHVASPNNNPPSSGGVERRVQGERRRGPGMFSL